MHGTKLTELGGKVCAVVDQKRNTAYKFITRSS